METTPQQNLDLTLASPMLDTTEPSNSVSEHQALNSQESTGPGTNTQSSEEMSEEAKEKQREDGKWKNYVSADSKRPLDEFFDLSSLTVLREESVAEDGGILKLVIEEGKGSCIAATDEVFYRHETRFSNGQLVDFAEKRKAIEKFEMGDIRYHDYYKTVMKTMRKGETTWVKFSSVHHKGVYHKTKHFLDKPEVERQAIGDDIWIRFNIGNIKRNPICKSSDTFEGIAEYY